MDEQNHLPVFPWAQSPVYPFDPTVPENARYELSGGVADKRSDLVSRGSAAAKSVLSLQRKAACRAETLQAAFC